MAIRAGTAGSGSISSRSAPRSGRARCAHGAARDPASPAMRHRGRCAARRARSLAGHPPDPRGRSGSPCSTSPVPSSRRKATMRTWAGSIASDMRITPPAPPIVSSRSRWSLLATVTWSEILGEIDSHRAVDRASRPCLPANRRQGGAGHHAVHHDLALAGEEHALFGKHDVDAQIAFAGGPPHGPGSAVTRSASTCAVELQGRSSLSLSSSARAQSCARRCRPLPPWRQRARREPWFTPFMTW